MHACRTTPAAGQGSPEREGNRNPNHRRGLGRPRRPRDQRQKRMLAASCLPPFARHNRLVDGFIVLEDGRAYAAANWATDATLRAVSREVSDGDLRQWLLAQQSEQVGTGMTSADLREIAPRYRPMLHAAIRRAHERVIRDGRFENLHAADYWWAGWLKLFGELVEMPGRSEAGKPAEDFSPHMRAVIPPSGRQMGPGCDKAVPP
jgi:hypothetical protein